MAGRTNWRGEQNYYYYTKEGLIQHSSFENSYPAGMHVCGIKDFIIPDPKFKVGDRVKYKGPGKEEFTIGKVEWEPDFYRYIPENSKIGYAENSIYLIEEQIPAAIGGTYRFSNGGDFWVKGKLLAIIDHKDKYVAMTERCDTHPAFYTDIRPIGPVKVERWANVFPSGAVSGWLYPSEKEAKESGNSDCKQMKMEGFLP